MCGRFTLTSSPDEIAAAFDLDEVPELSPRYNIAPTQHIAAVRWSEDQAKREFANLRWGLIPFWADDKKIGNRMINARAETAATKPAFRQAFSKRRCLIPADGFYEWKKLAGKKKQPYFVRPRDEKPLAFAGLWETWQGEDGVLESCTIITTSANALMESLHDRMPAILDRSHYEAWLDPHSQDKAALQEMLKPCAAELLEAYPVSTIVNNPRNESEECIQRLPEAD